MVKTPIRLSDKSMFIGHPTPKGYLAEGGMISKIKEREPRHIPVPAGFTPPPNHFWVVDEVHDEYTIEPSLRDFAKEFLNTPATNPCKELFLDMYDSRKDGACTTASSNPSKPLTVESLNEALEAIHKYHNPFHKLSNKGTNKMSNASMNINAFLALAQSTNGTDEFAKYDKLPDNLKASLEKKRKERADKAADEVAESILAALDTAENEIKNKVGCIRALRLAVEMHKANITKIERAREYGLSTQNFIPLLQLIGYRIPLSLEDAALGSVPDSFKMAEEVTKRAAKK